MGRLVRTKSKIHNFNCGRPSSRAADSSESKIIIALQLVFIVEKEIAVRGVGDCIGGEAEAALGVGPRDAGVRLPCAGVLLASQHLQHPSQSRQGGGGGEAANLSLLSAD